MKVTNVIKDHSFACNLDKIIGEPSFATSLEVVSEVMNVPMAAVKAIARQAGLPTDDTRSMCIDENMLREHFSSAFVRKTRNYFFNSIRNSALLSPADLQTFISFCESFKKSNITTDDVTEWKHIDTDLLSEEFIRKVKEKTHKNHSILEIFSGIGSFEIRDCKEYINQLPQTPIYKNDVAEKSDTLLCFTHTWCYRARRVKAKKTFKVNVATNQIYVPAHYYIYIDDDDHLTVKTPVNDSFNCISRMAS